VDTPLLLKNLVFILYKLRIDKLIKLDLNLSTNLRHIKDKEEKLEYLKFINKFLQRLKKHFKD